MKPGLKRTARAAFTLVELLATVTVIVILASLLLPALGQGKQSARSTQCKSNLHQWWFAWQHYTEANNNFN